MSENLWSIEKEQEGYTVLDGDEFFGYNPYKDKEEGQKGGPGSGNWGHGGLHGVWGGSGEEDGVDDRDAYLYTRRSEAMKTGVVNDVRKQLKKANPGISDVDVEMLIDAMSLDEERFEYYADKYDVDNVSVDEFFGQLEQIDKEQAKLRWKLQEAAAMKLQGHPVHFASFSTSFGEPLDKLVGNDYNDPASILRNEYNVNVRIKREESYTDELHKVLSKFVNVARTSPIIAATLRDNVDAVSFEARDHGTKTAEYHYSGDIKVYESDGGWGLPSFSVVHEIGHSAEHYIPDSMMDEFVRLDIGRVVSTYACTNPSESFAETFVAIFGDYRDQAYDWAPDKVEFVEEVLREAGVME